MQVLVHIKAILLIVACGFGVWRGVKDEMISRRERTPAAIGMADFPFEYRGQQWLSLTGRLDARRAVVRETKRPGDKVDLWIPLVAQTDGPDDPVHVYVLQGRMSPTDAEFRLDRLTGQPTTITGMQVFFDPSRLFRGVSLGHPFVMIQPGIVPSRPGVGLAIAIFCGIVILVVGLLEIRALRGWAVDQDD